MRTLKVSDQASELVQRVLSGEIVKLTNNSLLDVGPKDEVECEIRVQVRDRQTGNLKAEINLYPPKVQYNIRSTRPDNVYIAREE